MTGQAEEKPRKRSRRTPPNWEALDVAKEEVIFVDCSYCCEPLDAEALAVPPMASPLTTSSRRRLRGRPSAVSFDATGCVLPKPRAVMEEPETPFCARKSRTESARR